MSCQISGQRPLPKHYVRFQPTSEKWVVHLKSLLQLHRRELLMRRDLFVLTWHISIGILNIPPELLLTVRQRRVARHIRPLTHLMDISRPSRVKCCNNLCTSSGASILRQRCLAISCPFHPDRSNGGQIDGNSCEVEFKRYHNDDLADTARSRGDVDEFEERVVAYDAHNDRAGAEREDSHDAYLLASWYFEPCKDRNGEHEDEDVEYDVLCPVN
jgi:hypothetical protein